MSSDTPNYTNMIKLELRIADLRIAMEALK
jgi:hypothetical protein